jgi:hypothetical protein
MESRTSPRVQYVFIGVPDEPLVEKVSLKKGFLVEFRN